MEDLHNASKLLVRALEIREKYMRLSQQSFPETCSKFLRGKSGTTGNKDQIHSDKATLEGN